MRNRPKGAVRRSARRSGSVGASVLVAAGGAAGLMASLGWVGATPGTAGAQTFHCDTFEDEPLQYRNFDGFQHLEFTGGVMCNPGTSYIVAGFHVHGDLKINGSFQPIVGAFKSNGPDNFLEVSADAHCSSGTWQTAGNGFVEFPNGQLLNNGGATGGTDFKC